MEIFGDSPALEPCLSIDDVFSMVETKTCQFGLVPLENSIVGGINETLDRLCISELKIRSETQIPVGPWTDG